MEDISKSSTGGLAHLRIKNKVGTVCENVQKPDGCPVKLYRKYISHVPFDTADNSFYLRPLPKPKGNILYYKKAAGRETLGNVFKKVMDHFTNHYLRRSCATQVYDNGVSEQVIQETTGHRSVQGVRAHRQPRLDSSLGSDHERGNIKKRADRGAAKDQIEQHQGQRKGGACL